MPWPRSPTSSPGTSCCRSTQRDNRHMSQIDTLSNARRQAWTQYWAHGVLHSLPGTLDLDENGPPRAFWLEAFAPLADGAHMLDIGTGNGALPRLASAAAGPERSLVVHGVDIADVAPDLSVYPARHVVTFHPRCAAERLPFPDATFQLVTSQFGLEYTRLDASLPEVGRVLALDGCIAFVMHDARSIVARTASEEAAHARFLLGPLGFVESLLLLVQELGARRPEDEQSPAPPKAAAGFTAALGMLERETQRAATPQLLLEAHALARESMRLCASSRCEEAASMIVRARTGIEDALLRARELTSAALDPAGVEAMMQRLDAAGISAIEAVPIRHANGALLGIGIRGRKMSR